MTAAIKKTCLTAIIILALAALAFAQPQLPVFTAMVNDFAGKLSAAKRQQLESLLENFRTRSGIEVAVVTMRYDDLQGYALEDYSVQLARKWGIGSDSQKRSLLLLVAIKEPTGSDPLYQGSTRLEVSRHLEGDMPDGLAGEIIRKMRDDFQQGRFDEALTTGTQTILATLAQKLGISMEGVDQTQAYRAPARRPQRSRGISPVTILIIVFIVFSIIRALGRGGRGGPGGGYRRGSGISWMLWPIIFGGGRGGFGGGGWGGSSGSNWGGGGGDGGGFGGFGGGGDFGGGGASDNW
ncbi:MAG: TPM domain-containing protein [Blastocatellia bacterium]